MQFKGLADLTRIPGHYGNKHVQLKSQSKNFVGSPTADCRVCKCKCHRLQVLQRSFLPRLGKHMDQAVLDPWIQKVRDSKDIEIMFIASRVKNPEISFCDSEKRWKALDRAKARYCLWVEEIDFLGHETYLDKMERLHQICNRKATSSSVLAADLTGQADSCPLIVRLQKQSTCT